MAQLRAEPRDGVIRLVKRWVGNRWVGNPLVVLDQSKRQVKSAAADQPRDDDSIPISVKDGGIAHVAIAAENTNSDPWICA